ncbi:hypothetical protein [Coleofasciculus sp.]
MQRLYNSSFVLIDVSTAIIRIKSPCLDRENAEVREQILEGVN